MSKLKNLGFLSIFLSLGIIFGIASWGHGGGCDCEETFVQVPGPSAPLPQFRQATQWITDTGEDLDIYYGTIYSNCIIAQDNSIDFTITVTEAIAGQNVFLTLSAWDVDYITSTGHPELDKVYINGNYVGDLSGANDSWSINTFTVPVNYINAPGENAIKIEIDTLNFPEQVGRWCLEIDWGMISLTGEHASGVSLDGCGGNDGYDADGNGLFDTLKIDVSVTVESGGTFNLNGALFDFIAHNLIGWATTTQSLPAGTSTMTLEFNGEQINCFGVNGPYVLGDVTVYNTSDTSVRASKSELCSTSDYAYTEFETCTTPTPAPRVINNDPPAGTTGVSPDTIICATFDKDMDPSTITTNSFTLEETGAVASLRSRTMVTGAVEYDATYKEAKFIPDNDLAYGTGYTATITTDVKSSGGVAMESPYTWSFTTETLEDTLTSPQLIPRQYQMISVPLWASDPLEVFEDDLGPYDPQIWRLFRYDPATGRNMEYPDVPDVSPGIAYWLITRDGGTVDATGSPVTDDLYSITVPHGWFQVGNPYNGTVPKSGLKVQFDETPASSLLTSLSEKDNKDDTSLARTTTTTYLSGSPIDDVLWGWDASTNGWSTVNSMVPWGGYYIYNNSLNPVTLLIPKPGTGPGPGEGSLEVTVQDAITGDVMEGAGVTLNGFSATTNSLGIATIADTPTGIFTLTVSKSGYVTHQQQITLEVGPNCLTISLSPQLATGQIRIVLNWGENPRDLDSHLTGPDATGGRFHIYFGNRDPAGAGANLDRDDVSSYGPETITITEQRSGTYKYYIRDFTNQSDPNSTALAQSGARVDVYGETGLLASFTVPSGAGTIWHVFNLDGATGAITPVNTMSSGSVPLDSIISGGEGRSGDEEIEDIFRNLPHKPYGE